MIPWATGSNVSIIGNSPMSLIDKVLDFLGVGKIFSMLDVLSGFIQTTIPPASVKLTAFYNVRGIFECLRAMGAAGGPDIFPRLMNRLTDGPYVY